MKLLIQPGDGVTPLVKAIAGAKKSVEIFIFRCDRSEIERALVDAASRGVFVHALIACTNRGGEKDLRKLETQLLAGGITVARTSTDLSRYHDKLMIIDRRVLYLFAFNFTYLDIEHSRSFGIVTKNRRLVQEAVKLFEADNKRQPYTPTLPTFVISPVNARKQLSSFLAGAKKELLIYDPEISDPAMIRILEERLAAGVDIRIIGRLSRKDVKAAVRKLSWIRLHTRTIIRDRHQAFIGSQSLREVELDERREVGIIFRDPKVVSRLVKTFEEDWAMTEQPKWGPEPVIEPAAKAAKKAAKVFAKDLPPVAPVLEQVFKKITGEKPETDLARKVEDTVKGAVSEAVKQAVRDAVQEVVDQNNGHKPA